MQRAALDILKIFVHETILTIEKWHSKYPIQIYELVDNGNFRSEFINLEENVRKSFEQAKISDSNLGDKGEDDDKVLKMYVKAAFIADSLKLLLIERQIDFMKAQSTYNSIHGVAHNHSKWEHFKIHFTFYVFWTLLTVFLTWGFGTDYIKDKRSELWNFMTNTASGKQLPTEEKVNMKIEN